MIKWLIVVALVSLVSAQQIPNLNCCKDATAECLSCIASETLDQYCKKFPNTPGCPDASLPDSDMCCTAMTASCLACAAKQTVEKYCETHHDTLGCNFECTECSELTADCLACAAKKTVEAYCEKYPGTPKCPESNTPRSCCKAMTLSCLACVDGLEEGVFCKKHPDTPGCPPATTTELDAEDCSAVSCAKPACAKPKVLLTPSGQCCPICVAPACCEALTAECLACSTGLTPEEYCEKDRSATGCAEVLACRNNTCQSGEQCAPDIKQCFTTPCPQYKCESCAAVACPLIGCQEPQVSVTRKGECCPTCADPTDDVICCEAETATCLACKEKIPLTQYCAAHPEVVGCDISGAVGRTVGIGAVVAIAAVVAVALH